MATFTVWRFDAPDAADNTLHVLERLQKEQLIQVHDAAVVTYPEGARKPRTRQLHSMAGTGSLGGAFWGMLFGLIFFVPLLGMAVGAAAGALAGSLTDVGIDDAFIDEVREQVTPGTSALFLLTSGAVVDRVQEELAPQAGHIHLIHTNLSEEQEAKLRAAFTEDDVVVSGRLQPRSND